MIRRTFGTVLWGATLFVCGCGGGGGGGGGNTGGTADADPFGGGGAVVDAGPEGGGGGGGGDGGSTGGGTGGETGGSTGGGAGGGGPNLDNCATDDTCPEGYFCDVPDGAPRGACKPGCRQDPNTCNEPYLCDDTHTCVLDMRCGADTDCPADTWCNDGACVAGCKAVEPDQCPLTMDGRRQLCDPGSRQCTVAEVCCDRQDACSFALPGTCAGEALAGLGACANPNPCEGRCDEDDDCADTEYCGADGRCATGCRPDDNRACPNGQFCNVDTHACAYRSCGSDAECPNAQFCAPGGECLPGCRTDPDNCPVGSFCLENRQCGAGCDSDEQCVERNGRGWYCDDFSCRRPCAQNADCQPEELCTAEGRCETGCRDDAFEPNDGLDTARALVFEDGVHFESGATRLAACPLNSDFYAFDTPEAGWEISAALAFRHADGDLDLRLYDADGMVVTESTSGDDDEALVFPPPGAPQRAPAGRWVLEVQPRGLAENTYALTVDIAPPGGCIPDAAEAAAGDDSAVNATPVSLPQLQQQTVIDARAICPGDTDWFALRMGARDGLTVRLDAAPGPQADLDFAVFGPGLPGPDDAPTFLPDAFVMAPDGTRVYSLTLPRFNASIVDGVYYVRVNGLNADQTARYALTLSVDRDRLLCQEDAAEPNDDQNRAHDLMDHPEFLRPRFDGVGDELRPDVDLELADLWLCSGEQDWFRVELAANDELVARVVRREDPPAGDTRIEIRDARGQVVGVAGRNSQRENVARARQLAAGTYYVAVSGVAMTQTQYSLVLNRATSPVPCQADDFEAGGGNEIQLSAAEIPAGRQPDLTLCGVEGDTDWYVFEAPTEGTLSISLDFVHAQGDLDVDVFREGAALAENAGRPDGHGTIDGETVQLRNRPAGRYFIHVYGNGEPNTRYDLNVTFDARQFMCVDDPDEPNGDWRQATELGQAQQNGRATQWVCDRAPRDEDWFQMDVPATATRTVLTTFLYGDDGDVFLEVYDSDMILRASTSEVSRGPAKQCIVIEEAPSLRTFFVRVMPLAVNTVNGDERLDYQLYLLNDDDCDFVGLPAVGVDWPRVP